MMKHATHTRRMIRHIATLALTLFSATVFPELKSITEEREGLREVMIRHEHDIAYVAVDTELVRANLNSPTEYKAAYARWGKG